MIVRTTLWGGAGYEAPGIGERNTNYLLETKIVELLGITWLQRGAVAWWILLSGGAMVPVVGVNTRKGKLLAKDIKRGDAYKH
jgi:hypothetical protein